MRFVLTPDVANRQLVFHVQADRKPGSAWTEVWHATATHFPVPVGEWLTLELGYQMGDALDGTFRGHGAARRSGWSHGARRSNRVDLRP